MECIILHFTVLTKQSTSTGLSSSKHAIELLFLTLVICTLMVGSGAFLKIVFISIFLYCRLESSTQVFVVLSCEFLLLCDKPSYTTDLTSLRVLDFS
jgi:hypothetical protein